MIGNLLRGVYFGTVVAVALPAAGQSTAGLGELFDMIEPRQEIPVGRVDVVGWIERGGDGPILRINIAAMDGARLVADPGIIVEPVTESAFLWADAMPVEHALEGKNYFDTPQTVDVRLASHIDGLAEADVTFAYCLVDEICLFGEERISIPTDSIGEG